MSKKLAYLVMALLLGSPMLKAQVELRLDSDSILIGDQTTLTISGLQQFPGQQDLSQGDVLALSQWFDTVEGVVNQHTVLTSFEAGEHMVKVTPDDSILLIVRDVDGVDTTKAEIRDIAPSFKEPYTFWDIFKWVLLVLAVGAVAWGVRYVVRRIRNHQPIIELVKAPPVPPHEQALGALEELRVRQLWQQGKVKEYHTELTDILRRYMECRYGFNSTEMTSDQTLESFEENGGSKESAAILRQILQTADMVKFAKSEPQPYEHDLSMSHARQFVNDTKPLDTVPQPAETKNQ